MGSGEWEVCGVEEGVWVEGMFSSGFIFCLLGGFSVPVVSVGILGNIAIAVWSPTARFGGRSIQSCPL